MPAPSPPTLDYLVSLCLVASASTSPGPPIYCLAPRNFSSVCQHRAFVEFVPQVRMRALRLLPSSLNARSDAYSVRWNLQIPPWHSSLRTPRTNEHACRMEGCSPCGGLGERAQVEDARRLGASRGPKQWLRRRDNGGEKSQLEHNNPGSVEAWYMMLSRDEESCVMGNKSKVVNSMLKLQSQQALIRCTDHDSSQSCPRH